MLGANAYGRQYNINKPYHTGYMNKLRLVMNCVSMGEISLIFRGDYRDTKKGEDKRHMEHVSRQAVAELGLSDPKSREFWTLIIIFIITFFIRIYVHYVGQWLYLTAQHIPISG